MGADFRKLISGRTAESVDLRLVSVFQEIRRVLPLRVFVLVHVQTTYGTNTWTECGFEFRRINSTLCGGSWIGQCRGSFANPRNIDVRPHEGLPCVVSYGGVGVISHHSWCRLNNWSMPRSHVLHNSVLSGCLADVGKKLVRVARVTSHASVHRVVVINWLGCGRAISRSLFLYYKINMNLKFWNYFLHEAYDYVIKLLFDN